MLEGNVSCMKQGVRVLADDREGDYLGLLLLLFLFEIEGREGGALKGIGHGCETSFGERDEFASSL